MNYLDHLDLKQDPFASSPDPRYLYDAGQHVHCIQQVEMAVRLKRGLNTVIGDVGTGKTMLCRALLSNLREGDNMEVHLLLDPHFKSPKAFLKVLFAMFTGKEIDPSVNIWQLKEAVKKALFSLGINEKKLAVLIIDEGQKMTTECLEVLRELLNYETNTEKLLQIVLFGQLELEMNIKAQPNLADRINFFFKLRPMSLAETRGMINHRMDVAAGQNGIGEKTFSRMACWRIYKASHGFPRRIVRLSHRILMQLTADGKTSADYFLAGRAMREAGEKGGIPRPALLGGIGVLAIVVVVGGLYFSAQTGNEQLPVQSANRPERQNAAVPKEAVSTSPKKQETAVPPQLLPKASAQVKEPQEKVGRITTPETRKTNDDATVDDTSPKQWKQQEMAAKTSGAPVAPPLEKTLGTIRYTGREYVSQIIRNVYGAYTKANLRMVKSANPQIRNIDDVVKGTAIRFPAQRQKDLALHKKILWMQVDEKDDLSSAYQQLLKLEPSTPKLRILPYWSEEQGMVFAIVAERGFRSENGVFGAISKLPTRIQAEANILSVQDGMILFGQLDRAMRDLARR